MKRSKVIAAIVISVALYAALTVTPVSATDAAENGSAAEQTLLRLSELPGGYVLEPWDYCGPLDVHSYTGKTGLEAWAKTASPDDCQVGYRRLYRPPGAAAGPPIVATASVIAKSAETAKEAAAVSGELVENLTDARDATAASGPTTLGEETRVIRSAEFDGEHGTEPLPGVTLVWRTGAAIQVLYAGGWSYAKDKQAAYALAGKQQAHVEAPTPYLASEGDDIPTYFENPRLTLPAYWLGPTFDPGKGLERSYFASVADRSEFHRAPPGLRQYVEYAPSLYLDSWSPQGWRRFLKTPTGRRQWSWHCTRSRQIRLRNGRATIYAAYGRDYTTCPKSRPHHFLAQVHLPGVVIAINEPTCAYCQGATLSYQSERGMEAVVRGLRPWQPR